MVDMQTEGIPADTIIYCAAIRACEKGGQWQRVLQLMEDMQAEGVPTDAVTYSAAISTCEKGRQWQRALQLMKGIQAKCIPAIPSHTTQPSVPLRKADSGSGRCN